MAKLIQFLDERDERKWGLWDGDTQAIPLEGDIFQYCGKFGAVGTGARAVRVARLLPPVPLPPPNVFGIGLNYRQHAAETGAVAPENPLIFIKASTSVIGPGDPIMLPRAAPHEVDFEAELAIVIGKTARAVPESSVADYVLGYTCANDVTARDCQKRLDGQWARGKSFDTFCPLGPCLVPPAEFDPADAHIIGTRNGERMQKGRTSDMIFSCERLVSYLSEQFTLLPGTVICTGTPPGVGVARKPPVFLEAGDLVAVRIEGIGELANPVAVDR